MAQTYKNFLRRFIERYELRQETIQDLQGGVETGSDLREAIGQLRYFLILLKERNCLNEETYDEYWR